jgi:hypothetical protein
MMLTIANMTMKPPTPLTIAPPAMTYWAAMLVFWAFASVCWQVLPGDDEKVQFSSACWARADMMNPDPTSTSPTRKTIAPTVPSLAREEVIEARLSVIPTNLPEIGGPRIRRVD